MSATTAKKPATRKKKTPADFIRETTGPFVQPHPRGPLSDAEAEAIIEQQIKRKKKTPIQKAVAQYSKDPEVAGMGFVLGGDLVVWKREAIDPRIAAVMTSRLRPADIFIGKPCKGCGGEARYAHGGHGCIGCNRQRKRAHRDFFSKQLPLFDQPTV